MNELSYERTDKVLDFLALDKEHAAIDEASDAVCSAWLF
jgi:hypothetical protein